MFGFGITWFLSNKEDDIAHFGKCIAGLRNLDDSEIFSDAIERPELFVMKPHREGGVTFYLQMQLLSVLYIQL